MSLELISLVSDLSEIKGDSQRELEAVVIETSKSRKGPLASVVVRNGTLKVGETIYTEAGSCKIKNLFTEKGVVKEVLPGSPVQILGFDKLPPVGTKIFSTVLDSQEVKETSKTKISLKKDQIGVLIKAQNSGCLEAVLVHVPEEIVVVDSGIGDVNESDVLLAKASSVEKIFTFESKASLSVMKLADAEGVEIHSFKVIYELFQALEDLIKKTQVEILGKAEIIASFPFNNKRVAGCKVLQGKISKTDKMKLIRGEKELGEVKAVSLKKQKQEIFEAKQGEEFGVLFEPQLDFVKSDMIISVAK